MNDSTDLKIWLASIIEPSVHRVVKALLADNQPNQQTVVSQGEPISPEELCKRLDISKPTAWAWEKKGIIKGYHLGNKKYFIWSEVIAAMTKKGGVAA